MIEIRHKRQSRTEKLIQGLLVAITDHIADMLKRAQTLD